jgi:putative ABC transport system permease protein
MNQLFGISMNLIMYVLVALLVFSLASVAFVALRNRIMFKLGIRNIPRRRAQTTLIVLGLMLSTVIISAAFTTGDTVDRSVTSEVYRMLGSVDEQVVVGSRSNDDTFGGDPNDATTRQNTFAAITVDPLVQQFSADQRVDYVIPVYSDVAVAVNEGKRLSSPLFNLAGLDPESAAGLPDLRRVSGGRVEVSDLGPTELYLNQAAADELDLSEGDSVSLFTQDVSQDFTVKAIIENGLLAGSVGISTHREGGVVPLSVAQEFFRNSGQLTMLAISNQGDSRGGLKDAIPVGTDLKASLSSLADAAPLTIVEVKRTSVNFAEEVGNVFTTFFLALGLFSIGAGVLLIFMIFVMLAAERKSEMGMARAIGTKRMDLVQTFLSEGMAYNVLAAAVGTAIGVGVAVLISRIMASLFSSSSLDISSHVTARSLIISYSLGVVLTFLTVTFSSWRISLVNIVRAIRDIPDPPARRPQWRSHGFLPTLRDLFFRPTDRAGWRRRLAIFVAAVLAIVGMAGISFLMLIAALIIAGVFFSYAWSQSTMPVLLRIGMFLGLIAVSPISLAVAFFMTFQLGPLFLGAGVAVLITFVATSSASAFLLLFGLSLAPLGLAFVLRSFGFNERVTYTLTAIYLIYIWEFDFSVGLIERIFGKTNGNIEMFFLSGVMVTVAATFLVVYNADLVLLPLTRMAHVLGALLPSIKMAVAYPLANKMRTGMTMAMFCLVVFALIVISSMNHNFNRLFLSDRALGGYDIVVDENPSSPIGDLQARLAEVNSPVLQQIEAVGTVGEVGSRNALVCQVRPDEPCAVTGKDNAYSTYDVRSGDQSFLASNEILLQARARGYNSDRAVWAAMENDASLAVVDSSALISSGGGFGGSGPFISGIDTTDTLFDPVAVMVRDRETNATKQVTVIGIIETGSSNTYSGLFVAPQTFNDVFGAAAATRYFVKTTPGTDNQAAAREIEGALLTTGAQADSLRKILDDQASLSQGFFYLIQGFMGLGLFVGVAAVGVIAFRTVVERRQQIGMLRAIGYTRNMIGLTFLIESAFIAFMGVLSGVVFALILARQLIIDQFANQGVSTFSVPWQQVFLISGLAFGAALVMTLIPSRQAASIPIAQALRYE